MTGVLMGRTAGLDTTEDVKFMWSSTKVRFGFPQGQHADSAAPSTGAVITDDITPGRFPIKAMLKWGGWFQGMFSAKEYVFTLAKKKIYDNLKLKTNYKLSMSHFALKRRLVICVTISRVQLHKRR